VSLPDSCLVVHHNMHLVAYYLVFDSNSVIHHLLYLCIDAVLEVVVSMSGSGTNTLEYWLLSRVYFQMHYAALSFKQFMFSFHCLLDFIVSVLFCFDLFASADDVVAYELGEKSVEALTSLGFQNLTFRSYEGYASSLLASTSAKKHTHLCYNYSL